MLSKPLFHVGDIVTLRDVVEPEKFCVSNINNGFGDLDIYRINPINVWYDTPPFLCTRWNVYEFNEGFRVALYLTGAFC